MGAGVITMKRAIILFILLLLLASNAFGAMEDISSAPGGWTHTDAGNTVTETKYRVRSEATPNNTASTYHYKTISAITDFTHYFTFGFDTVGGNPAQWGIWGVSDTVADLENLMASAIANAVVLSILDTGSVCKIYVNDKDTTTTTRTANITISEEYRYRPLYGKVVKSGTTFNFYIYREPARITLLYTLSATLHNGSQSYTKLFMGMNGGYIAGAETLYENFTTYDVDWASVFANCNRIAQTFTPTTSHRITKVTVCGVIEGTPGNITATILDTSNSHPNNQIGTSAATNANGWSTSYACNDITLTTQPDVVANTMYAIQLTGTGRDTSNRFKWYVKGAGGYSGGAAEYGNPWATQTYDLNFKEYGSILFGYVNSINAFSSELWIDETPIAIFNEIISTPLLYAEDYDGFNGFPDASHEAWIDTVDGSATIVESSAWSSDGDGKSVLITGVDGTDDGGAYFTPSSTTWRGGMISFDFKLSALGTNQYSQIVTLTDNGTIAYVAYVQDVGGTKYFRVTSTTFNSTSIKVICELNTVYHVTFSTRYIDGGYVQQTVLTVNGRLADSITQGSATLTLDRVYIGYSAGADTYKGGTRYIDNLKYMNGTGFFPSIARGGNGNQTLVAGFVQDQHHALTSNNYIRILYSNDNGLTWTYSGSITVSGQASTIYAIRWCNARQSWYFFISNNAAAHSKVYECTSLTTPTINLIRDYDNDSKYALLYPSRILDSTGKLYVSLIYYTGTWDSTHNYATSARFNWEDGAISSEYRSFQYGDIASKLVDEPMLWLKSDGTLCSTIRLVDTTARNNAVRYRCSTDLGLSDWYTNTLMNPGNDWVERNAIMRAFVFRGIAWWQGRDNQATDGGCSGATGYCTDQGIYESTFILKSDRDNLNFISEMWWEYNGESGNGDIDACSTCYGMLYLDFVSDMFGTAWYKRLYTGEIATEMPSVGGIQCVF